MYSKLNIIQLLKTITAQTTVFPFYHAVSDTQLPFLNHLYKSRTTAQFKTDIETLLKLYKPLSVNDLFHQNSSKNPTKNGFLITFDDGLRAFKEQAWPILKAKKLPVILFVNPDFVGNNSLFFRFKANLIINKLQSRIQADSTLLKIAEVLNYKEVNFSEICRAVLAIRYHDREKLNSIAVLLELDFNNFLEKEKPYLTLEELKQLQAEGVTIGAHSMDHPLFNELSQNEQQTQVKQSVDWVNAQLRAYHRLFSFPFTDFGISKNVFDEMYNKTGVELSFGTAGLKKERFKKHLQRIPVEESTASLTDILLRQYVYYLAKAPFFKNTIRRK